MTVKICIDLLDWLFQPSFDFEGFCECMDNADLHSTNERIVYVRGFPIESWGVDNISPYVRASNGKFDLRRLSGDFQVNFYIRTAGCTHWRTVASLREWCGIRAEDKWPTHPWNKANNIQRIGGLAPVDLARIGQQGAVSKLVLPLFHLLREINPAVDWELSNEPSMKWCLDSEIELANALNDLKIPQTQVHGSCSPETFSQYGDRPLYSQIETLWVHNCYLLDGTKPKEKKPTHIRSWVDPKNELPGFEPGGRYHDKVLDVRPSGDGQRGNYWNYTPAQIRDIARAYEGYAMLWNPKGKPVNWKAEWKRTLPYLKALAEV